jgi:hypothetical protein
LYILWLKEITTLIIKGYKHQETQALTKMTSIGSQPSSPQPSSQSPDLQRKKLDGEMTKEWYEAVLGGFDWDNCNIIRVISEEVNDLHDDAVNALEWSNLTPGLRAVLPCLHTLEITTLTQIDVVSLYKFIIELDSVLQSCMALENRYKIINKELSENLKNNIDRFKPEELGEDAYETELICEAYTEILGTRHVRVLTAEQKAISLAADARKEEQIRANAEFRRRQQHLKKSLVKQTTQRGVLKGRMREVEKNQTTTNEINTLYEFRKGVGKGSSAIIDKYAPTVKKEETIIDPNRIIAGANSINILACIKNMDKETPVIATESGLKVRREGGKFIFDSPNRGVGYGGSVFSSDEANARMVARSGGVNTSGLSNWGKKIAENANKQTNENGNNRNDKNTKNNQYRNNDDNPPVVLTWNRGSKSDQNPIQNEKERNSKTNASSASNAFTFTRGSTNNIVNSPNKTNQPIATNSNRWSILDANEIDNLDDYKKPVINTQGSFFD